VHRIAKFLENFVDIKTVRHLNYFFDDHWQKKLATHDLIDNMRLKEEKRTELIQG
jgi:hypothetical protein